MNPVVLSPLFFYQILTILLLLECFLYSFSCICTIYVQSTFEEFHIEN